MDFEYFCRVKRCLQIVSFLVGLAMLVACSKHAETPRSALRPFDGSQGPQAQGPQTQELSQIDTLMWHQPDSAFAVMMEFAGSEAADSLDVFEGHYCQVLIAELLYKNSKLHPERHPYSQKPHSGCRPAISDTKRQYRFPCGPRPLYEWRGVL